MYDVITIGGATLDIFLDIHEASEHCRIEKEVNGQMWLSIKNGEKVPLDGLHYDVGGGAANLAVGLSRLGLASATYIHYGSDEISQKIVSTLKKEHVATEFMVQDQNDTSSISIIINFQGERTIFFRYVTYDHALPAISVPKWMYLASTGERWEDLYRQVVDFVKTNNVKLAFCPGSHQYDSGVDSFMDQVRASYVLFVNKDEGKKIANFYLSSRPRPQAEWRDLSQQSLMNEIPRQARNDSGKDVKTFLTQLQAIGPKIVSITDGSNGSFAIDESGVMHQLPAFPVTPLERTGAGDSYAAGFLAAIAHGLPVAEAMRWGAVNAASVITTIGAEKGLLHKEEIEKKLSEHSDFKAGTI